jgi:hypothetical protein
MIRKLLLTLFIIAGAFTINAQTFTYNGKTLETNNTFVKQSSPGNTTSSTPEVSGIARGRRTENQNFYWANCDDFPSGKEGCIFVLNSDGTRKLSLKVLKTAKRDGNWKHQDWEDICMVTRKENGVDKHYIIVGGFGDNGLDYAGKYYLYIIPEPAIGSSDIDATSSVITITYRYPNNKAYNAESLMYDPIEDQIIVVNKDTDSSKNPTGNPSRIFTTPFRTSSGSVELKEVATLGKGKSENKFFACTAADMSKDGMFILIKSDNNSDGGSANTSEAAVLYWERACITESFSDMINREPKYVTGYAKNDDSKGEAIAWSLDSKSFTTTSDESGSARMNLYSRLSMPTIPIICSSVVTQVTKPELIKSIFTYDGSTITVSLTPNETSLYTMSGTISASAVGSYSVKVSLRDKSNYTWADGSTADLTLYWSITNGGVVPPPGSGNAVLGTPPYSAGTVWINDKVWSNFNSGKFLPSPENICFTKSECKIEGVPGSCSDGNSNVLWVDGKADGGNLTFTVPNAKRIRMYIGAKGDGNRYAEIYVTGRSMDKITGLDADHCKSYEITNINSLTPVTVTIQGGSTDKDGDKNPIVIHSILVERYDPIVNVSFTSLNGFTYAQGSGPSAEKTFTVSGERLIGNVTVNAPAGYEMSTNGTTWDDQLTFIKSGSTVSQQTVRIRLKRGLTTGNYNANIEITTTYNKKCVTSGTEVLTAKTISLTGNVTTPPAVNLTVTVSPTSYEYNGTERTPSVTVKDGAKTLIEGTDYTISYNGDRKNVGTATVIVTGKGTYAGKTNSETFTIIKKSIAVVWVNNTPYTYNGNTQAPTPYINGVGSDGIINLSVSGGKIDVGTNYTATASFSPINNNYTLTNTTSSFSIVAKEINAASIVWGTTEFTYNGNSQVPTAYINGVGSGDGKINLNVSSGQINAGNYTATASCPDTNYKLTGTLTKPFTINPKPITVTVTSGQNKMVGTSDPAYFEYTITSGSLVTNESLDGKLARAAGESVGDYAINIGNLATSNPNYDINFVSANFTINSITGANNLTVTAIPDTYEYTGSAITPTEIIVKYNSTTLVEGTDYTITSITNNVNVGTANIAVEGKGNYAGSAGNGTFTITSIEGTNNLVVTAVPDTYEYTGSAITPTEIVVTCNGKTLAAVTDYTVTSITNNVNAGTANIAVEGKGNYAGSAGNGTFTITSISGTNNLIVTVNPTSYEYTGSNIVPTTITAKYNGTTLTENVDYKIDEITNNINVNPAVLVSVTGINSYEGSTGSTTFAITKAPGIFPAHPPINTEHNPDLILDHLDLDYDYKWDNSNTQVDEGHGQEFDVTYTHPSGNYESVGGKVIVNASSTNTSINDITVNGNLVTDQNGNNFYYIIECGQSTANIKVNTTANAKVSINYEYTNPSQTALQYGNNVINIKVTAQNGDVQNYTLSIERRIPANVAFYDRFEDVLTVPVQVAGIGDVHSVEWYFNGNKLNGDPSKGYLEIKEPGIYYSIINGIYRTCEVPIVNKAKPLTMSVYPNPAAINQQVTVNINFTEEELQDAHLRIYSMDGRLYQSVPVTGSQTNVTIPFSNTNTVIVKLISNKGTKEEMVILK